MILMDIMRSPETLKEITGTSMKKKLDWAWSNILFFIWVNSQNKSLNN